jgi:hypothetical protein
VERNRLGLAMRAVGLESGRLAAASVHVALSHRCVPWLRIARLRRPRRDCRGGRLRSRSIQRAAPRTRALASCAPPPRQHHLALARSDHAPRGARRPGGRPPSPLIRGARRSCRLSAPNRAFGICRRTMLLSPRRPAILRILINSI